MYHMIRTIHEHLRYKTFCTRYDTYRTIRIAYRMILTTMDRDVNSADFNFGLLLIKPIK